MIGEPWRETSTQSALVSSFTNPLPCLYGYLKLHQTCELAEEAIQSTLDGFMVFSGYCSFLLIHHFVIHPVDFRYVWELDLINKPNQKDLDLSTFQLLTPEIIWANKDSELIGFTILHAGVIASSDCQFLQEISCFIRHKIPVYFFWGNGGVIQHFD